MCNVLTQSDYFGFPSLLLNSFSCLHDPDWPFSELNSFHPRSLLLPQTFQWTLSFEAPTTPWTQGRASHRQSEGHANKLWMADVPQVVQRIQCVAEIVFSIPTQLFLDTDILRLSVAGTTLIVLDTSEAATELLEKKSSIYSGRCAISCGRCNVAYVRSQGTNAYD